MVQSRDDQRVEQLVPDFVTRDEGVPLWKMQEMGTFFDPDDLLLTLRFDDHRLLDPGTLGNYFVGTRDERILNTPANALATSRGALQIVPSIWPGLPAVKTMQAATNLIVNPSAEINVTDYVPQPATGAMTQSNEQAINGTYSAKFATTANTYWSYRPGGAGYTAVASNTEYTQVVWWYAPVGGDVVQFYWWEYNAASAFLGNSAVITTQTLEQGWNHFVVTATTQATCTKIRPVGAGLAAGNTYYFDCLGLYLLGYDPETVDGDMGDGYSWTGTPHNSTSARVANSLLLDDFVDKISQVDTLSFSFWFQVQYDSDATWSENFCYVLDAQGAANNDIRILYNATGAADEFYLYLNGTNLLNSNTPAFSAGDWIHLVVTIDFANDSYKMYFNGMFIQEWTNVFAAPTLTDWAIGGSKTNTQQSGMAFAEVVVLDRVLTAVEIANMYAARRPVIDGSAIDKQLNVGMVAYKLANQSIPNNVWTPVEFDTIHYNEHLVLDTTNHQVNITQPGWYQLSFSGSFDTSAVGTFRGFRIRVSGVTVAENIITPLAGLRTSFNCNKTWFLSPSDIVVVNVTQNSGGALNLLAAAKYSPYLSVVKIRNVFESKY